MADTFEVIVLVFLAVFSVLGGIPHLFQWLKPKPHLKITSATIEKQSSDNFRYDVHMEVENQKRWWNRSSDASNIVGEYFMIDKNGFQWGAVSNQAISSYLLPGTKTVKDIEGYHSLSSEGNPYLVIFRVTCNEKGVAKQRVTYKVPT